MDRLKKYPLDTRYGVTEDGRVFDYERNKFSNVHIHSNGYCIVKMRGKNVRIHRAVWITYKGTIPDKMEVDHIDFDRQNNHISNLQLLTHADNLRKSEVNQPRYRGKDNVLSRPVFQILSDGKYKYWDSMSDVTRELGYNQGGISACCRGVSKTYKGYRWKYA